MNPSRWLTWAPNGRTIDKVPDHEPPKPSKVLSEGFEGAPSDLFPIAECSPAERHAARSQIFRWVRARCMRRRDTWVSGKSLWHDYVGWCQQQKQFACSRELFVATLDQLFRREMDGWQGIALAIDFAACPHIM